MEAEPTGSAPMASRCASSASGSWKMRDLLTSRVQSRVQSPLHFLLPPMPRKITWAAMWGTPAPTNHNEPPRDDNVCDTCGDRAVTGIHGSLMCGKCFDKWDSVRVAGERGIDVPYDEKRDISRCDWCGSRNNIDVVHGAAICGQCFHHCFPGQEFHGNVVPIDEDPTSSDKERRTSSTAATVATASARRRR